MMRMSKQKYVQLSVYVLVAAFYYWMAAQIPYTHDDWDWGLDIGITQLLYATINSRYAGNFFEVIMTRSEFLKVVIIGSVCFLIPYLMSRVTAKALNVNTPHARLGLFLTGNVFLLTTNRVLWKTTCGWAAGFANFCMSAPFLMIWILEIIAASEDSPKFEKGSILKYIGLFLLCVIGQLFLENVAIYCVLLAITLCITYYIRFKKIPERCVWMLVGALVGLAIVFSSSFYGTLMSTGMAIDGYREVPLLGNASTGTVVKRFANAVLVLGGRLFSLNVVLMLAILLTLTFLLLQNCKETKAKQRKIYVAINIFVASAFVLCNGYKGLCGDDSRLLTLGDFIVSACLFVVIIAELRFLFQGKTLRILMAVWLSAAGVIAPLAVTSEFGHRLFFTSNIFLTMFEINLLICALHTASSRTKKLVGGIGVCLLAACIAFYGVIYAQIGACKREHEAIIEKAIQENQEQIVLPSYPYENYLHCPYPVGELRTQWFKEFYGIDEDVVVIFEKRNN